QEILSIQKRFSGTGCLIFHLTKMGFSPLKIMALSFNVLSWIQNFKKLLDRNFASFHREIPHAEQ
ncbi:MAG: hypothetical protein ACR2NF_06500, partial [Pirellulales bacterium]